MFFKSLIYVQFTSCVQDVALRKKCLCLKFFWSALSRIRTEYERCRVSLRIQSDCGKMRTRITPNTNTFHSVLIMKVFLSAKVISELYIRTFVAILIVIKFLKKRILKAIEMVTKMQIRANFSKPDASKHLLITFGGLILKKKD